MAQIDQTRPHEPIPGLADQIICHTQAYNAQFSKGVEKEQITSLDTDTIYDCCPFGEIVRDFPGYDDWAKLHAWQVHLESELTVKGKNEWAKRILNHINGINEPVKTAPFWRQ